LNVRSSQHLLVLAAAAGIGFAISDAEAFDRVSGFVLAQAPQKAFGEAEGVIKGVDVSERQLLITHGPISGSLQMPAMTMAFQIAPDVDLSGLVSGAKVKFTVSRDAKGLYVIDHIQREN
jgi:Cu(I)/Ag(I) efflux system protein CusF